MPSRDIRPSILWDMNGVLLDDEIVHEQCFAEILASFCGISLNHEDYLAYFIGKTDKLGFIDFFKKVEQDINPDVLKTLCAEKNKLYVDYFSRGLAVNPSAQDLLEDLNILGYKQALVTCDQRPDVDAILQSMLPNVFDATVAAQDVKHSKPYMDPYEKAAVEINADSGSCIVIEDTVAGVLAARRAGARVIGFAESQTSNYARQLAGAGAERIVTSLEMFSADFFDRFMQSKEAVI